MYTMKDVRDEYDRLDTACGVDTSHIQLKVSTRGIYRFGSCTSRYIQGRYVPTTITLADHIFKTEDVFWQTIRHEYAHALATLRDGKRHGHDAAWKRACLAVGCTPARVIKTAPSQELKKRKEQRVRYILVCKSCGHEYRYYRRGKVVDAYLNGRGRYHCSKCHGDLMLLTQSESKERLKFARGGD